ncbi:tenecin-1-like [Leptinotarsa decemlineata]|uniref:tenecin-1-like n=1 Tax=Leptinotarsa decemlineata TaxID=7539 RepID=UPI003D306E2E
MTSIAIFGLIFSCLVFGSFCLPITPDGVENPDHHENVRVKRFICDTLSVDIDGINDAACSSHCLMLLKPGGYCNSHQVCVCKEWKKISIF